MKIGIEVEVENLPNPIPYPNSVIKHDGSLRNNGIEYVSTILDNEVAAKQWYSGLLSLLTAAEADFNKRCGVHIHMNFRGTNKGVRQAFLLKYLVIERNAKAVTFAYRYSTTTVTLNISVDTFLTQKALALVTTCPSTALLT